MPGLLCLPDEVLKLILTNVPLKDRLGSCCLVHTRLHGAAVAATQQLDVGHHQMRPERAQSVLSWLSCYGQHVTQLKLWNLSQPLTQLQACPNLLELRLYVGDVPKATADGRPGMLEGLTKLTRLDLFSIGFGGGVVDSASSLVHLKHLNVNAELSPATLPRLQRLTHLTYYGMSLEHLRQLSALTALQELDCRAAHGIHDSPGNVSGWALPASLTQLVLRTSSGQGVGAELLRVAPTGLRALRMECDNSEEGYQLPPFGMARLQCLTALEVHVRGGCDWPLPGPAYAAFTASSSLVSLQLDAKLPTGMWPYVFCAHHQLPHLTCLDLNLRCWDDTHALRGFGAADVAALVCCCPGLRNIKTLWLQPGPHVSELHKLTALTSLRAACGDGDPVGSIQGLAAVAQLQDLVVDWGTLRLPLGVASLLPLTSLTALTTMLCSCYDDYARGIRLTTRDGSPPDAWLQLLEGCAAADSSCQPIVVRSLAQQLAEQRALTAGQAQEIAGLRAQLSAQQQVASEQGARMAALEGMLQQLLQR